MANPQTCQARVNGPEIMSGKCLGKICNILKIFCRVCNNMAAMRNSYAALLSTTMTKKQCNWSSYLCNQMKQKHIHKFHKNIF
jgi:hypothetical protein